MKTDETERDRGGGAASRGRDGGGGGGGGVFEGVGWREAVGGDPVVATLMQLLRRQTARLWCNKLSLIHI